MTPHMFREQLRKVFNIKLTPTVGGLVVTYYCLYVGFSSRLACEEYADSLQHGFKSIINKSI